MKYKEIITCDSITERHTLHQSLATFMLGTSQGLMQEDTSVFSFINPFTFLHISGYNMSVTSDFY